MSDFYYDQLVNANNLNKIAADLGKTDFSEFSDGIEYPVSDLNKITATLCGKGITSNLNKFRIIVSDSGVTVCTGTAIFTSGRKITVSAPIVIPFMAGELFLEEIAELNTVNLKIGVLPETNDYIHLATINEDSTYTDKREIARALTELPVRGNSYVVSVTNVAYTAYTFSLPTKGIEKLLFVPENSCAGNLPYGLAIFDTKTNLFYGLQGISTATAGHQIRYHLLRGGQTLPVNWNYDYNSLCIDFVSEEKGITTFKVRKHEYTLKYTIYAFGGVL